MGKSAFRLSNNEAEPFKAIAVFTDGIQLLFGDVAFELGGDLFGCPFAGGSAQQVADGGELFFGLFGPFLLFDGFDDGFFGGENFEGDLLGLSFFRSLVFGAEPADEAVAFFFGAFGVEGDEVFEDLFVGDIVGPAVGV
ncbi:MAG: hypothetical protein WA984_05435 [Phormidesmis sp.]